MTDKVRIVKDILKIIISILVISVFVKSCSKALTVTEVERLTYSAINDYKQAQGITGDFNYSILTGDLSAVNKLLNQNVWTQQIPNIPFEDYDSFIWYVWIEGNAPNRKAHVWLKLFNDLDFNIEAGNTYFNSIQVNLITCTTNQPTITSVRFDTERENQNFNFGSIDTGQITLASNYPNNRTILYTTGEIYNSQNLLYFGGQLNRYTPLEFDQEDLDIVSYNGDLARYYQR